MFARAEFGLSKKEFFRLLPRQLAQMQDHWIAGRRERHMLIAMLQRDLINYSFYRPKQLVTLGDLIGPDPSRKPKAPGRRMTAGRRANVAKQIRGLFGMLMAQK